MVVAVENKILVLCPPTFNLWVSNGSLGTSTDWPVSGEEALGSRATIAGVLANPVNARLVRTALVI